jgi:hypothetical protein
MRQSKQEEAKMKHNTNHKKGQFVEVVSRSVEPSGVFLFPEFQFPVVLFFLRPETN